MENTTKKWLKIAAIVLAVLIVAMSATLGGMAAAHYAKVSEVESVQIEYNGEKLNIILMIGDGMGFNHVKAATAEYGDLFFATMATGVIATEGVDGATPAGFSAHTSSRNNLDEILQDQLNSGIDLFFGSNSERYEPLKGQIEKSYTYVDAYSDIAGSSGKIFAAFDEIPLAADGESKPTLASLAVAALDILSKDADGFFLMIEESHIDKYSHNNQLADALEHVKAYDNAVKAVAEYAKEIGNTIVIVTADHETGGLQYNGETAAQLSDDMYTKGSHSKADVPFYVFGDVDYDFAQVTDNTLIAKLCQAILAA